MANPHQLSQYEKTCNSPGRSQHKGTGSDDFDRNLLKFQSGLYIRSFSQTFMRNRTEEVETTLCYSLYIITTFL